MRPGGFFHFPRERRWSEVRSIPSLVDFELVSEVWVPANSGTRLQEDPGEERPSAAQGNCFRSAVLGDLYKTLDARVLS